MGYCLQHSISQGARNPGPTGMYYYGYRYYDAGTGRWVSRDPIGEISSKNLATFIDNDPAGNIDTLGLLEYDDFKMDWVRHESIWGKGDFALPSIMIWRMINRIPGWTYYIPWQQPTRMPTPKIYQIDNIMSADGVTDAYGEITMSGSGVYEYTLSGGRKYFCLNFVIKLVVNSLVIDDDVKIGSDDYWGTVGHEVRHIQAMHIRTYRVVRRHNTPSRPCYCSKIMAESEFIAKAKEINDDLKIQKKLESDHDRSDPTIPTPSTFGDYDIFDDALE